MNDGVPMKTKVDGRDPVKTKVDGREEYAKRHAGGVVDTHNAISALSRIDDIIEQSKSIEHDTDPPVAPGYIKETLVDYYVVALCTAMEWHARTRLVDMLIAYPDAIIQSDVDNALKVTEVIRLAKRQVSIPHALGSRINISTEDSYFHVFKRLFSALGLKEDPVAICSKFIFRGGRNRLGEMFSMRHRLVHEISLSEIGPFHMRGVFSIGDIHDLAMMCRDVFVEIEKRVSSAAPERFPNCLDANLNPINEMRLVVRDRDKLEVEALELVAGTGDEMEGALRASSEVLAKEIEAIESSEAFNIIRFADFRTPLIRRLLEGRIAYLKALIETLNG